MSIIQPQKSNDHTKTKKKQKTCMRTEQFAARILNFNFTPPHKPSTEKAKSELSKIQKNPLIDKQNPHSRSYQD